MRSVLMLMFIYWTVSRFHIKCEIYSKKRLFCDFCSTILQSGWVIILLWLFMFEWKNSIQCCCSEECNCICFHVCRQFCKLSLSIQTVVKYCVRVYTVYATIETLPMKYFITKVIKKNSHDKIYCTWILYKCLWFLFW